MMNNEEKTKNFRKKSTIQKEEEKKKKMPQRGFLYPPRWAQKFFYIRTVKRNPNEIEAQTKSDFKHLTTKMKENERT